MADEQKYDKAQAAKQYRTDHFERQGRDLQKQGYEAFTGTISVVKANIYALLTAGPFVLIGVIAFFIYWKQLSFTFGAAEALLYFLLIMASLPLHELIHGIAWSTQCKKGWGSIYIGVVWKKLTPFCHCMEPLSFKSYLFGGLAPFAVLGVAIYFIAFFTGNILMLILSFFNMVAAGGDLTIALMLLPYPHALIVDHPTECGFVAFVKKA